VNLDTFAAERSARLTAFDDEIRSIVAEALENYGQPNWFEEIVTGAAVLWLEIFEREYDGDPEPSLERFRESLRDSLAKTSEPSQPPTDAQIDRVMRWVGVYSVNHATYYAGRPAGGLEKTWITMEDPSVRPTHRVTGGQTVPIGGRFNVGGFELRFPGEPVGPPEIWINCRCLLAITGRPDMGTNDIITASAALADEELDEATELTEEEMEGEDLVDDLGEGIPWHGVLVVEGIPTGDRRQFDPDSISYGTLPLPLAYQRTSAEGHMQSVVVGRIDEIWREENGEHRARGLLNYNVPETDEVVDGIMFGSIGGVSVDVDSAEYEIDVDEEADEFETLFGGGIALTRFTKGRIRGATLVGIPAFEEAYVALGPDFDEELRDPEAGAADADGEVDGGTDDEEEALVAGAAFAPGTKDGPGWITNPRSTARLRRYWVKGKGALKIRWGAPGDFNRCRRQLAKYVNPAFLAGTCANLHKEATGTWPGRQNGRFEGERAPAFSLVASAAVDVISASYFENPNLTEPTRVTVDGDRVFGHIAVWGTCHIGIGERCVMPPSSPTNYSFFHRGAVETDQGLVRTGPLVMWTGHAGTMASALAATKHYDDTGTAVADIVVGEDAIGIWFSGRIRDTATAEDVQVLRASSVSGDWRDPMRRGTPNEMVGLLAVNVPGFPIPAVKFGMDGDRQVSLVASGGLLLPEKEADVPAALTPDVLAMIGRAAADEIEYRTQRRERLATLRDPELLDAAAARRAARIAEARSLIPQES